MERIGKTWKAVELIAGANRARPAPVPGAVRPDCHGIGLYRRGGGIGRQRSGWRLDPAQGSHGNGSLHRMDIQHAGFGFHDWNPLARGALGGRLLRAAPAHFHPPGAGLWADLRIFGERSRGHDQPGAAVSPALLDFDACHPYRWDRGDHRGPPGVGGMGLGHAVLATGAVVLDRVLVEVEMAVQTTVQFARIPFAGIVWLKDGFVTHP